MPACTIVAFVSTVTVTPTRLPGPILRIVGIDPGTRRMGLAAITWDRDTSRADVIDATTIPVDVEDLHAAVGAAIVWGRDHGAQGYVIEHGGFYAGRPKSYDKNVVDRFLRGLAARQHNHAILARLTALLTTLAEHDGVRVRVCAQASWAHRVVLHATGITDAMVAAALPAHFDAASMALLATTDRRDAAGAALWSVLVPTALSRVRRRDPDAPRRPRPLWLPGEREDGYAGKLRRARRLHRVSRLACDRRRYASPSPDPAAALARLTAECPCGPHPRGRRPRTCPAAAVPLCSRCRRPVRGHVQGLPCPPPPF